MTEFSKTEILRKVYSAEELELGDHRKFLQAFSEIVKSDNGVNRFILISKEENNFRTYYFPKSCLEHYPEMISGFSPEYSNGLPLPKVEIIFGEEHLDFWRQGLNWNQ